MVAERDRPNPAYKSPLPASPTGPRFDAEPTNELPTLTPGISTLPTSCQRCGSRFLNVEPPLGEHERGMITCGRCSRQLCWLKATVPTCALQMPYVAVTARPAVIRDAVVSPLVRPIIEARFKREPGCGQACSIVYGHDPATHEAYGRRQALREIEVRPAGIVRTGDLVVDFDTETVMVAGRDANLTPTETAIVLHLAGRLGTLCPYAEIIAAVWGHESNMLWSMSRRQLHAQNTLRTNIDRTRGKLGAASRLIQTARTRGYLLSYEPTSTEAS